jgi:hypothetical protein
MLLIQALHGQRKSTKNNAMPRVYPYGIVLNTNTQSIVNHSIGVNMKLQINQIYMMPIFGKVQQVKVIKIHPFGTIDVELSNGKCFRISGLSLT